MSSYEKNAFISKVVGVAGCAIGFVGFVLFLLDRETWQGWLMMAGLVLMVFAQFADN